MDVVYALQLGRLSLQAENRIIGQYSMVEYIVFLRKLQKQKSHFHMAAGELKKLQKKCYIAEKTYLHS